MTVTPPPLRVAVTLEQCWHRVPGGTAAAALDTVDALVELGDVDVQGQRRRLELIGVSAFHRAPARAPWTPPIPVAALGLPRRMLYESWHRLGRPKVERATGPVDVIHVTGLAMPPASVPIVVTLHDLAFRRHPGAFTRHGLKFFEAALAHIRADATLVLCSSDATRVDAVSAGLDPGRLRVVPLGVRHVAVDDEDVRQVRAAHDLPERYVLNLATAEPRKNRATLLAAMARLPDDVHLVLAGASGWGSAALPEEAPPARRVHDLGFVTDREKHALLKGATVFCFPSLWEGFGLPVLEAMAQATPVVSSAGTAMAEVLGDTGVLVDPTDGEAMADAIRELLDDGDRARSLGEAGRRRAADFTWERTAKATATAYADAVAL